ncbi:hypothetical protein ACG7TL_001787 [Trametes sanguinea]
MAPTTRSRAQRGAVVADSPAATIPGEFSSPSTRTDASIDSPLSEPDESPTRSRADSSSSEGRTTPTYSQVVASRRPSAEHHAREESPPRVDDRETSIESVQYILEAAGNGAQAEQQPPETSGDGYGSAPQDEGEWIEVRRKRRGRSSDSATREAPPSENGRPTSGPPRTIATPASPRDERSPSRGEGGSNRTTFQKGKAVDPLNWGTVGIDPDELDPEAQRREFEKYEAGRAGDTSNGSFFDRQKSWEPRDASALQASVSSISTVASNRVPSVDSVCTLRRSSAEPVAPVSDEERAAAILAQMESLRLEFAKLQLKGQDQEGRIKIEETDIPLCAPAEHSRNTPRETSSEPVPDHDCARSTKAPRRANPAEALVDHALTQSPQSHQTAARAHPIAGVLRPVSQVQPQSYLGHAFQELAGRRDSGPRPRTSTGEDPYDSSSSPPSSSGDSDANGEDSSGSSANGRASRKRKRKPRRDMLRPPTLKPREPKPYNGAAEVQVFHRFVQEMTAYIDGYQLPASRHAITISWFLTGKAYEFYLNTVSDRPRDWTLRGILIELFNYCFPIDFRQRMREKLARASQGNRSVREYVHELKGLFLMVGHLTDEAKVEKLWFGLKGSLQAELWKARLDPLTSSWSDVQSAAEIAEIALAASSAAERNNSRSSTAVAEHRHGRQEDSSAGDRSRSRRLRNQGRQQRDPKDGRTSALPPRNSRPRDQGRGSPANKQEPFPKLSDREKDELRAAGKCFVCRETGHMSRNCPRNNRIRSDNKGKPPGVSAYGVSLMAGDTEALRAVAESSARIEELEFNAVSLLEDLDTQRELTLSDRQPDWACTTAWGHTFDKSGDRPAYAPSPPVGCDSGQNSVTYHSNTDSSPEPSICATSEASSLCSDTADDSHTINEWGPAGCEHGKPPHGDYGHPNIALPLLASERRERSVLRNLFEERAMDVLEKYAPYLPGLKPGDDLIYVFGLTDDLVGIEYGELLPAAQDGIVSLPRACLEDADFDLVSWFRTAVAEACGVSQEDAPQGGSEPLGDALAWGCQAVLNEWIPWPDEGPHPGHEGQARFSTTSADEFVILEDTYLSFVCQVPRTLLRNTRVDLPGWYAKRARAFVHPPRPFDLNELDGELARWTAPEDAPARGSVPAGCCLYAASPAATLTVQRNAVLTRDFRRLIPEPVVVVVKINGQPVRALLDSGSLADFMSAKAAQQLGVRLTELEKPLAVQLAVQGSRAKVNYGCKVLFEYQDIKEERYFDVMNVLSYDLILGTPFLSQHQVFLGFNPAKVVVGSVSNKQYQGTKVRTVASRAADLLEERMEVVREELRAYAAPICREASDAPFPPLRAINHTIPLKDPSKVYSWRPSKCPDALRHLWIEKRDAYLKTGRWKMTTARNTSPMLLLTKPGTGVKGVPPRLRVVCDLRERNANTIKVTSPLPDMEGILRRVSRKPYRSLIDGKDAYEQIRVAPEHVERTAMTTPDGNMVSLVLQQGDCNAVATYQSLMNHIFGEYIGVFMDVYLDDIIIYSDTLEDHRKHCKLVIDRLRSEELYLSATKLRFLCASMKILGRIVDDEGIRMDPEKVDNVLNWKTPTSKELLRGFLGAVGYLADDIASIRIPMGVLTTLTGSDVGFRWDYTEQRAFDEIKRLVHAHCSHHRKPLDYSPTAPRIWLVTDGSVAGIAGVVTQGSDWRAGHVAAFYSAKLSPAQSNYPVHEIEMLAGVESMLRHRDILLGCHFTWVTDHKGLTYLLTQKNLSARQVRWLEKIAEFDFEVEYVPGIENVLADALSRIYSYDAPGTVRAASEYVQHDDESGLLQGILESHAISAPVLTGVEAAALIPATTRQTRSQTRAAVRATLDTSVSACEAADVRKNTPVLPHSLPPTPPAEGPPPSRAGMAQRGRGRDRGRGRGGRAGSRESLGRAREAAQTMRRATGAPASPTSRRDAAERHDELPPESGRPETSREFAKRIRRVVLHGPRANGQEGGEQEQMVSTSNIPDASPEVSPTPSGAPENVEQASGHPPDQSDAADGRDVLLTYLAEGTGGIDFLASIRGRYDQDPFFRVVLENPRHYKNFRIEDGLVFLQEQQQQLLCVPAILISGRSAREIIISYAHSLLAHLGSYKTLTLLRDHFWWKTMAADVRQFCDTCQTCRRSKPSNQRPYGLLHPLKAPKTPWEVIGIDFVGPLPESKNRNGTFDSITVIIDLLTGMVHLVPSRTNYTARQVAELVFDEVYKHHGMPKAIVSDRDSLFTSTFWTHLHRLVGVELRMSSAYHPESDGSTERANRTVTQMLRQCIGPTQRDWTSKLPAIEFAINLARSDTTGYAPFFLNTGRMPRSMVWDNAPADEYAGVRAYAQRVKQAIIAAHDSILAARTKQVRDANRKRRPVPFTTGDLVYLSTKNLSLPKGMARKLAPKFIGPYKIVKDYGNNSFKLDLPSVLRQKGIHDVFHASLLRIHEPNDDRLFPGRSETQVYDLGEQDGEWAIDRIVSHKGRGSSAVFEVLWKAGDRSWVPLSTLENLPALQNYLELLGVGGVGSLPVGDGKPPPDDPQLFLGATGRPRKFARPLRYKTLAARSSARRRSCTHPNSALPKPRHPRPPTLHPIYTVSARSSRSRPSRRSTKPRALPPTLRSRTTTGRLALVTLVAALALALCAALGHMVFNGNSALTRLRDQSVILRESSTGHRYHFSAEQLRLFGRFDEALRHQHVSGPGRLVPAGYELFRTLWAQDAACPYRFAEYSPDSGITVVEGEHLPVDELAPPPAVSAAVSPSPASRVDSGYTPRQQAIVDSLIWSQLERNQRQQEFYRLRREARQRNREAVLDYDHPDDSTRRARRGRAGGNGPANKKAKSAIPPADPEPSNLPQARPRDGDDDDMDGMVLEIPDDAGQSSAVEAARSAKEVGVGPAGGSKTKAKATKKTAVAAVEDKTA